MDQIICHVQFFTNKTPETRAVEGTMTGVSYAPRGAQWQYTKSAVERESHASRVCGTLFHSPVIPAG